MPPFARQLIGILALLLALLAPRLGMAAATLLPNGEQCFQAQTGINGMVGTLGTITPGTGGTAGTYANITLTGSMSGQTTATANITVSGGGVTAAVILNPGTQYVVGDVLTASSAAIGNVTGFSVPVNSVSINSSLAGGSVTFYIPNTNTFKQTWKNSTQTTLNTNPVGLDQNGCAIIYGTGSYRQVLKDSLGNTIWDQLTTDTSANNNTFWAGQASGTTNAITVVDPGFNATDGTIIDFIPLFNNTGPTTLNPSGFGNVSIVKDTTAGPVALTGGEIIATTGGVPNIVSVIYSATQNNFHLLNAVIQSASGASAPLCGAIGLKITNNTSTPNTIITVTAGQVVMQTTAGLVINRSNVSVNINISTGTSTATANGMDGEAVGTNRWLNVFLIDNGAAPAGLASIQSGNSLNPTQPSGYSYKCRLGAMPVDGSGNLFKILQYGAVGHWTGGSTAGQIPCQIASGVQGTYSATAPALAAIATAGDGACAPSTATAVNVSASTNWKGAGGSNILVAPNSTYSGANNGPQGSNGIVFPIWSTATNSQAAWITLETPNLYLASSGAGAAFFLPDWKDDVNAN